MFSSLKKHQKHQNTSVRSFVLVFWLTVWTFLACPALGQVGSPRATRDSNTAKDFPVTFTDVAGAAGLSTPTIYGGIDRKRYIIETNGCGVAFFDYDNDGWIDILILSGTRLEALLSGEKPTNRLYRNNHNGTFTEVTYKAGLRRNGWASRS